MWQSLVINCIDVPAWFLVVFAVSAMSQLNFALSLGWPHFGGPTSSRSCRVCRITGLKDRQVTP